MTSMVVVADAVPQWVAEPVVSYGGALRRPPGPGALVFLGFPHEHWDAAIEGRLPAVYGTRAYATALAAYLAKVAEALDGLAFVNSPAAVAVTRDKLAVKRTLLAAGVPTPRAHFPRTGAELLELAAGGVYVKAICGSMGKGITHLRQDRWRTGYLFDGRALRSPAGEHWPPREVPVGTEALLDLLCSTDGFLFEEEIRGEELRVTVVDGDVLRIDSRTAPASGGDLPPELWQAAAAGARALSLRYAVFDVLLDAHRRPYLIDVQAFPALETPPVLWRSIVDRLTRETPHHERTVPCSPQRSSSTL
ncbi:RimK family alpha-L-glutamate ligase [Microbispora sp. NPDC049125]|uniref:ATP-grasp domain-containing protein n=1 Tax=Microbispora sp. NPDC049125 TaxID=3154929 RepID=UPI0034657ACE